MTEESKGSLVSSQELAEELWVELSGDQFSWLHVIMDCSLVPASEPPQVDAKPPSK